MEVTTEPLPARSAKAVSLSPDGTKLLYNPTRTPPTLRYLDGSFHAAIPGLEFERDPFFSPNGEWVAYFHGRSELRKIRFSGGTPVTLCEVEDTYLGSGSWGDDGAIVFTVEAPSRGGNELWLVPDSGGTPEVLIDDLWSGKPEVLPTRVLAPIMPSARAPVAIASCLQATLP